MAETKIIYFFEYLLDGQQFTHLSDSIFYFYLFNLFATQMNGKSTDDFF